MTGITFYTSLEVLFKEAGGPYFFLSNVLIDMSKKVLNALGKNDNLSKS